MLLCEFWDIFQNIFFTEKLRVTDSDILMQVVVSYDLNLSLQFVTTNLFSSASFQAGAWFNVAWISESICFLVGLFLDMPYKTASKEK